ncbi:MAG: DNA polymerase III subunit beta [Peptococcaceae bacterium]|jgi:DNA polymerase-3 subunit beta|nr:DNA polymerase III subunit beta [Peptococcaceae bacterium]
MRLITSRENLLTAVNAASKAINPKSIIPVYAHVKLEAKDNNVILTGVNLESSIECAVPAQVEKEGSALIPAKLLGDIVRRLPEVSLTLETKDDAEIILRYENSFFTLRTQPDTDFPSLPSFKGGLEFSVEADALRKLIRQTFFAASLDDAKTIFTGLLWEIAKGELGIIGTDSHRLAWARGPAAAGDETVEGSFVIPARIASEVARLLQGEPCHIQADQNTVFFSFDQIKITCRLMEGIYPAFRDVIPTDFVTCLKADSRQLSNSIERVSLFAASNEQSSIINFDITDTGVMTLHSRSKEGYGQEEMAVEISGENLEIAFNGRYMSDMLKVTEAEKVEIKLSGKLSAGTMQAENDPLFLYLILPVRV